MTMYHGFTAEQVQLGNSRLLKLADFLENNVTDERFGIERIAYTDGITCNTDEEVRQCLKNGTCGSTGCVVGVAPFAFPSELRYAVELGKDFRNSYEIHVVNEEQELITAKNEVCDGLIDSFYHARNFFRLSPEEVSYLFMPDEESKEELEGRMWWGKKVWNEESEEYELVNQDRTESIKRLRAVAHKIDRR